MKPTSAEYDESMASNMRGRSHISISVRSVNSAAPGNGNITYTTQLPGISDTSKVETDYIYQDLTYATLELNRWVLDGKTETVPDALYRSDGYICQEMSDLNAKPNFIATIKKEFTRDMEFPGLTIVFDSVTGDYPKLVNITTDRGLNENVNCFGTVFGYRKKIVCRSLQISFGTSFPYRRCRVKSISYGIDTVFREKDISSCHRIQDIDPLSRRLPKDELSFSVLDYKNEYNPDNPQGDYQIMDKNSEVYVRYGYTLPSGKEEWLSKDKLYLSSTPVKTGREATFFCVGPYQRMNGAYYKSRPGTKSLYDMAEDVFRDSGILKKTGFVSPWVIDESLGTMYTNGILPIAPHKECLQIIAHAAGCVMTVLGSGQIAIKKLKDVKTAEQSNFFLDFGTMDINSQVTTRISALKAIVVNRYDYTNSKDVYTIYDDTVSGRFAHIEFQGMYAGVAVTTDPSVSVSFQAYANAIDLNKPDGAHRVIIQGYKIEANRSTTEYKFGDDGEIDTEDNQLITSDQASLNLMEHVKAYLSYRSTYDCGYRGNPEVQPLDIIHNQTAYSKDQRALVLVNQVDFNGALHGAMKVKAIT